MSSVLNVIVFAITFDLGGCPGARAPRRSTFERSLCGQPAPTHPPSPATAPPETGKTRWRRRSWNAASVAAAAAAAVARCSPVVLRKDLRPTDPSHWLWKNNHREFDHFHELI